MKDRWVQIARDALKGKEISDPAWQVVSALLSGNIALVETKGPAWEKVIERFNAKYGELTGGDTLNPQLVDIFLRAALVEDL